MPIIIAEDLSCGYTEEDVVKSVDLKLVEGDFLGVIGPNGSGKSTLLRAICGVLPLRRGNVSLDGVDIKKLSRKEVARNIAVIPQGLTINFNFTVEQVVLMGRMPHIGRFQWLRKSDLEVVSQAMKSADITHLRNRFVTQLSGGEQQRVIIARALAQEPRILLLDEPSTHLDINHKIEVFDLLRHLNREHGLTILCVSHDLNISSLYSERLMLLQDGSVFSCGPPWEIITQENIEKVYGAKVIIERSPVADRPQVAPVPQSLLQVVGGLSRDRTSTRIDN